MKKRIILSAIFLLIIISLLINYTIGFPIVINISEVKDEIPYQEAGAKINLLENCNFDEGNWTVYLVYNREDYKKDENALPYKVYKTTDKVLLKKMKKDWFYNCTGGDMATVQSEILFFQNNELVYSSNIILNKDFEGFQSPQCGWISKKGNIIYKYCKEFKPVWFPIVIL